MTVPDESRDRLRKFLREPNEVPREKLFGQIAVSRRMISIAQLEECLAEQKRRTGVLLGKLLLERGYLNESQFAEVLREQGGADASPLRSAELPPDVAQALQDPEKDLGRYVLLVRLAEGGSGSVWRGWQKDLHRFVAIKFLEQTGSKDARRFDREVLLLSQIEHPNIARVYDMGHHGAKPYLVMQYIDGKTAGEIRMEVSEAARLVRTVAIALHDAHRHGIVHRDVKPSNIMVDRNGGVFVTDFGLARKLDVPEKITITGSIMGTPGYLSPEQARGEEVDVRTDVYSLGASLYELVCGRPPQEGESLLQMLEWIERQDPQPPRKLNPQVPTDLETIILKCLSKEAERRYATAEELADDLGRFLAGEPIRARRGSMTYRLRKTLTRNRRVAAVGAIAILIALVSGGYFLFDRMGRQDLKARWVAEARAAEQAGRWEEALGAYERASALDPSDATIREKKSEIARRVESKGAAADLFHKAELDLHSLRLRTYRAGWKMTEEEFAQYEELINRCHKQMERTGDSADGWWVVGRAHHVLGDRPSAEAAYLRGSAVDPGNAACTLYRARLMIEQALVERFTRRGQGRRNAEATIREATRLLEQAVASGHVKEIELDLARGYELVVKNRSAKEYCAEMLKKWSGKDFWEEFYLIRGIGHTERLIEDATEAIKIRPGFFEAYRWRGSVQFARGDFAAAIQDFSRAIEINPRFVEAYNNRGGARHQSGDAAGAIQDYVRVIEITPRSPYGYLNRGTMRALQKDLAGALQDFEKAIELDPQLAEAYYDRGNVRRTRGDTKGAAEDYARAIELAPDFAEAFCNRGTVRHASGDVKGALDDYERAIAADAQYPDAYYNRGLIRGARGEIDAAIEDYTRAIELRPDRSLAYNNRGSARMAKGDLDGAIEDYTRALQINPRDAMAATNRGIVRSHKGDAAGAIADFTQAIEADPKAFEALLGRGQARQATGDPQGALADFDRAIALNAQNAIAYAGRALAREDLAKKDPKKEREYLEAAEKDMMRAIELTKGRGLGPADVDMKRIRDRLQKLRGEY